MIKVLNLGMVNVFILIGTKGNVLVDTGMAGNEKKIVTKLQKLGIDPSSIKLMVLTHNHEDHIGSVKALAELTGAKIAMHKVDYELMTEGDDEVIGITSMGKIMMATAHKVAKNKPDSRFNIDIEIDSSYELVDYGIEGKILHTPGHTKGSLSILMENGEAIIADSVMAMMPWSKPGKPIVGYDLALTKKNILMLMAMGAQSFYLSHGKCYDKNEMNVAMNKLI